MIFFIVFGYLVTTGEMCIRDRNMYLTFNFGYAIFAPKGTFY